ncbi:MAG TPA: DUF5916 domain-containing protein [Gemmatimonadales bacterium]|nr:DUF5916 domain-containing protein [Gemmatimonadales bacterium]
MRLRCWAGTAAAIALLANTAAAQQVYSGLSHQLDVTIPRLDADPVIDGQLDEPAWQQAARLTGFSQYSPTDGVPAADSTDVLVWYSATAIYFGVKAYEAHGAVHGTLANRDNIFADDNIQIYLSTFHDGRQATLFAVNPLGVQADGALVESGKSSGGTFGPAAATGGREPVDLSPDYVFQSKGEITAWGYEVEVRIPFKSLRYQAAAVQDWGLDIERDVQHDGTTATWAPARRAASSFLAQSGTLDGLTDIHRGLVMDLNPEVTGRRDGSLDPATNAYGYRNEGPDLGGNLRWGVTNNLTLNATVTPDFSQVESDAGQIVFDPRQALYFPEKRPFFLDGLEFFQSPFQLVYTRQIVQPVAAVKLTGKAAGTNIGVIAAVDGADNGLVPGHNPVFGIVRAQRDIGAGSKIGVVLTDRTDGPDLNQVGAVDGRFTFAKVYSAQFQVGMSHTLQDGVASDGPIWYGRFTRAGHTIGLQSSFTGISDRFATGSGFIGRTGVAEAFLDPSYSVYGKAGGALQRATLDVVLDRTWQYQHLIQGLGRQDDKLHLNLNAVLKGGWTVGGGYFWESFGYDSSLFANYRLLVPNGGGVDTVAYTGQAHISNGEYVVTLATPTFRHFDANVLWLQGHDENYPEWASGDLILLQAGIDWRPNDKLRIGATYYWQRVKRPSDRSIVNVGRIPRLTFEYQVSRPFFVRLVGQYVQNETDSLRDNSRTELPVYLLQPGGSLLRAGPQKTDLFHVDALLSYQPGPGTVVYAGYGSNQIEPVGFKFQDFQRLNDAFFVKVSYLFRM